jgi:hypothetical protein
MSLVPPPPPPAAPPPFEAHLPGIALAPLHIILFVLAANVVEKRQNHPRGRPNLCWSTSLGLDSLFAVSSERATFLLMGSGQVLRDRNDLLLITGIAKMCVA